MFGETIAVYLYSKWQQLGSPNNVKLLEMGPGRGTLMNDILTVAKRPQFSQFYDAIESVNLVEVSPALREQQTTLLSKQISSRKLTHHATLFDFEKTLDNDQQQQNNDKPAVGDSNANARQPKPNDLMILSHEFYDCLATNIYRYRKGQWLEQLLSHNSDTDEFQFVLHKMDDNVRRYLFDSKLILTPDSLTSQLNNIADLDLPKFENDENSDNSSNNAPRTPLNLSNNIINENKQEQATPINENNNTPTNINQSLDDTDECYVEVSLDALQAFETTAMMQERRGGCQLLIDYGNLHVNYPSLRYIVGHEIAKQVDSEYLHRHLGNVDLSVDVHFAPLMQLAHKHGLQSHYSSQGAFLRRNAIEPLFFRRLANCYSTESATRL